MRTLREERNRYKVLTNKAAELERVKNYKEASSLWKEASILRVRKEQSEWCDARANFCARMNKRPF